MRQQVSDDDLFVVDTGMDTKRTLVVEVPLPSRDCHPNSRAHWGRKSRATKNARQAAELATHAAMHQSGYEFPWARASLQLTYYSRTNKKRDDDNLISWAKATRDGIAAAGVVADDNDFIVDRSVEDLVDKENPRLVVTVRRIA